MRVHEQHLAAPDIEHQLQDTALFAWPQHLVVGIFRALDREARQHGIPIFAALVGNVFCEVHVHAGELREFGRQVTAAGANSAAVDFL